MLLLLLAADTSMPARPDQKAKPERGLDARRPSALAAATRDLVDVGSAGGLADVGFSPEPEAGAGRSPAPHGTAAHESARRTRPAAPRQGQRGWVGPPGAEGPPANRSCLAWPSFARLDTATIGRTTRTSVSWHVNLEPSGDHVGRLTSSDRLPEPTTALAANPTQYAPLRLRRRQCTPPGVFFLRVFFLNLRRCLFAYDKLTSSSTSWPSGMDGPSL
jgi:hypothetical protein